MRFVFLSVSESSASTVMVMKWEWLYGDSISKKCFFNASRVSTVTFDCVIEWDTVDFCMLCSSFVIVLLVSSIVELSSKHASTFLLPEKRQS